MTHALEEFWLDGRTAILTGGGGILGAVFARTLAEAGAHVWVTDIDEARATAVAAAISAEGLAADALRVDVLNVASIEAASKQIGAVDILLNAAGGNAPAATTTADRPFFDLPLDALERVVALNLFGGAILPSQVFGRSMVERGTGGVILNVSSMSAILPLTRVPGYSAAKAAVSNFTQWLAVHMAREYDAKIRVNALAPGFFLTDQNRYLLADEKTGELTERGRAIIAHTPMGRFGDPKELAGATLWLCSDAAAFVTGVVLPIDGGYSAFGGV